MTTIDIEKYSAYPPKFELGEKAYVLPISAFEKGQIVKITRRKFFTGQLVQNDGQKKNYTGFIYGINYSEQITFTENHGKGLEPGRYVPETRLMQLPDFEGEGATWQACKLTIDEGELKWIEGS